MVVPASIVFVFTLQFIGAFGCSNCNLRGNTRGQVPPDSALVVVDMQNDFISGSLQVPDGADIIGPINSLMALPGWALTVFTMDYHPQNHISFAANSPFNKTDFSFVDVAYDEDSRICGQPYVDLYGGSATTTCPGKDVRTNFSQQLWPVHCVQGTWGQRLDDRLRIPKGATTVKKGLTTVVDSYGAFENNFVFKSNTGMTTKDDDIFSENSLQTLLKVAGVKNVYMTGLALDYCVKYTAMQAISRGFNTSLIKDATRPVFEQQGMESVAQLQEYGVHIIEASDIAKR